MPNATEHLAGLSRLFLANGVPGRGEVAVKPKELAVMDTTERWRVLLHSAPRGTSVAKGRTSST